MPKSIAIRPDEVRQSGRIEIAPIPINSYRRTIQEELALRGPEPLGRLYRDMAVVRAFETMLNEVKLKGSYKGIEYNHRGPAHLSIGQEASAVGQAYTLDVEDHIYGSHRSHGEILAKGLSAIEKLDDDALAGIMKGFWDGETLRVVDDGSHGSVKDLALDFLLYGALAEIFARSTGFNRGMGGSMHAFFTPFGIYPNNAIVGGSADIATGAALFKHVNRKRGIVVANIGDASAGCGPVWEAMCFATMDQFRELWQGEYRAGLPMVFNFMNNFYGMGGQPVGETMGFKVLARLGAGLNPENMHAERVDGYNPLAVVDAYERKKKVLAEGQGPVLLDTLTYRFSGHSPSDASSYRDKTEVEEWQQQDSLVTYANTLRTAGVLSEDDLAAVQVKIDEAILRVFKKAIDPQTSPYANLREPSPRGRGQGEGIALSQAAGTTSAPDRHLTPPSPRGEGVGGLLDSTMLSNGRVESFDPERTAEIDLDENVRTKQIAGRSRSGVGVPKTKAVQLRDALFEAIADRFAKDATMVAYGEENRDWGGAFAVYRGLTEALPYHRLFNSPISEAAIVGTGVGYALEGGRALVELMYCDFMGRAGDEIFNQMAKWQAMSGGVLKMPLVLRVSVGSKYGAQHSQDWSSICAHIPGLKVVFPATPYDAKGLMASALVGTDPVVFFESQRLYDQTELFHEGGVPEEYYEIPIGQPDVKRSGKDLTILTIGATLYRALEAAETLSKEHGVEAEVIDARSLVPFDYALVLESVRKTRKIVLASDASERGSFLHTMASNIARFAFDELDAPPVVVGARNWITPPDELEEAFFPFPSDILDAIHREIKPLPGYQPGQEADLLKRNAEGV
ncbi:MAG TPA: thiamine pyrophosphate-dependent enzyme [Fimbriimonas sp.]